MRGPQVRVALVLGVPAPVVGKADDLLAGMLADPNFQAGLQFRMPWRYRAAMTRSVRLIHTWLLRVLGAVNTGVVLLMLDRV